jgi:hypothetical protein
MTLRTSIVVQGTPTSSSYVLMATEIAYINLTVSAQPTPDMVSNTAWVTLASDGVADATGRYRYIQHSVVTTDGAALLLSKPFEDQVSTSDSDFIEFDKSLADSVSLQESFLTTIIFLRDFFDSIGLTDATVVDVVKAASDSVLASDAASRSFDKSLADAQSVFDAAVISVSKALAHSLATDDAQTISYSKLLADASTISDAAVLDSIKALDDLQLVLDASSYEYSKSLSDGVGINDGFGASDGLDFVFSTTFVNVAFASDELNRAVSPVYQDALSVSDSGTILNQDYCDPTYFAEAYVGAVTSF